MPTQTYVDQTFDTWTPGSDSAVLTLGQLDPYSSASNCVINAKGAEWGLKLPKNVGSTFNKCSLIGGTERTLDIVRGTGMQFSDCVFSAGADRAPTKSKWSFAKTCDIGIKGGATNISFSRCTFTDMLLGDHCIYDNVGQTQKTSGITLTDCVHPAGKSTPIILRVINAELPTLINTNAAALVYWGPIVKMYFWIAGKWIDSRIPPAGA